MTNTIKWGIVGTGNIANKFAKAIKNVEGAELYAVASRALKSADEFAEKYNIEKRFPSYAAMAESTSVDAVYIALPHTLHAEISILYLKNKKNVLCEKPAAVNVKEFDSIVAAAKENGVFFMEAMWTRFLPAIHRAKQLVGDGVIGKIRGASVDFSYSLDNRMDRVFYKEYAGGSLLDVGVYGLNFAEIFINDEIAEIKAMAEVINGVDGQNHILIKYKNGAITRVSSGITLNKPSDGYLYGDDGYIYIPDFYTAKEFEIVKNNGSREKIVERFLGNGFEEEIYECCKCISEGKKESDIMPMSETRKIIEYMDLIRNAEGIKYPSDF